jgi:tetratricopeptide (TPR) repeat protein
LLPVYIYNYFKSGNKIKTAGHMYNVIFMLIGLSVYLYLPIRAGVDGIFVFWARPDNWRDFWWTILRYGYETKASLGTSTDVLREFFGLTLKNYLYLIILFPFGAYILYKTNRKIFAIYAVIFFIMSGAVIFLRIPSKELLWEVDSLVLPAQFLLYVFIILGSYYLLRLLKKKGLKYGFTALLAAAVMAEGLMNFRNNDSSKNYISYDFGNNITKSAASDSVCLLESDYYLMPLVYFSYIEHKINNAQYQSVYSMQYKWGIESCAGKYGAVNLKEGEKEITANVYDVIRALKGKKDVFLAYYVVPLKIAFDLEQEPQGILYKIVNDGDNYGAGLFDIYSYRGIFDRKSAYDNNMTNIYGERMAALADEYLGKNDYYEAIKWYKKALDFPLNSRADRLFNLSVAYKFMMDADNELKYLNMSIMEKPDFTEAVEALGLICYQIKAYPPAKEMLGKAIELGSGRRDMLNRIIEEINKVDINGQYTKMYNSAVSLLAVDKYEEASYLFDYLIKKKVNDTGVARNMGVYFLKHNDFKLALDYFIKEKESDNSADSVKNIAYTYYKLGNIDAALTTLKHGISDFKNDPGMSGLYDQINKAKIQGAR